MYNFKDFRKKIGKTQIEMASLFGCQQSNISALEKNDRDLTSEQYDILYNEYGKELVDNYRIEEDTKVNTGNMIPFYDYSETVGGRNMDVSLEPVTKPTSYINTGDWFRNATAAIRHTGHSMIQYPKGCILALKIVNDKRLIIPGRDYVIETEEYRVTKQIQLIKEGYITAYSTNEETYKDGRLIHPPFDIPWDAVKNIFLVLGYVVSENGEDIIYSNK
jgi:transcriptional regulator with XRE-family HTH domain